MVSQREMPFLAPVAPMQMLPADLVARCSFSGALNECVRCDGRNDCEICRDLDISPGYMSKFLRSVGESWARRMVKFMRSTRNLAPLQVLAHEMGCELVVRDSRAHCRVGARADRGTEGCSVIDLDAIKAAGLNSNAVSARLLAQHEYQERVQLYLDLCRGFAEANPQATTEEVEQYRQCAAMQAGI